MYLLEEATLSNISFIDCNIVTKTCSGCKYQNLVFFILFNLSNAKRMYAYVANSFKSKVI